MEVNQININGVTFNRTDSEKCWRLIHNGAVVISLEESGGVLNTKYNVFLATTEAECQTEIYALNLEYNPPLDDLDNLILE